MRRDPTHPHRLLAPPLRRVPLYRRPSMVALGSAGLGFVCGALFWHALGFWSFVSHVVLRGPVDDTQREVAARVAERQQATATMPVHLRPTGSISPVRPSGNARAAAKSHETCSDALPDDVHGETTVVPCLPGTLPAPSKSLARKSDLLIARTGEPPVSGPAALVPRASGGQSSWNPTIRGQVR